MYPKYFIALKYLFFYGTNDNQKVYFFVDGPSLTPMPQDFISEPGIRNQIFQSTFREEYGNMAQYDFIQTVDDLRCSSK